MHAYVRAALDRELAAVRTAPEGTRAQILFRAAKSLGGFVPSGLLDGAGLRDALAEAARACELPEGDIRSQIQRGLRRGAAKPRRIPGNSGAPRGVSVPLPGSGGGEARPGSALSGVAELWAAAAPVTFDPEVATWLESRGLDPVATEIWDLCRAIPADAKVPRWAWTRAGGKWTQSGHRLVVRVWSATGACGALRARAVREPANPAKSLAPLGAKVAGLVMACPLALQVLAGRVPSWWESPSFVIAEGEPDFLTWAARQPDAREPGPAVIGVEAGSWTRAIADRIPDGARVVIRTHADEAGNHYAQRIAATLVARCELLRPRSGAAS